MAEPNFARGKIVATEATQDGFAVRVYAPPREGWEEAGPHWRFKTRLEALQCASILAVDLEAATLNDHDTAIAPVLGGR